MLHRVPRTPHRGRVARGRSRIFALRTRLGQTVKKALAALAFLWVVFGFMWATAILLPVPSLTLWPFAFLASEFSLVLAAFALVGIGFAAIVRRLGFRRTSIVAASLGAATVILCLVPVGWAWQTDRFEDVSLSFPKYFAGISAIPERPPTETVEYARPEGEPLTLDVWEPPGDSGDENPAVVMVHGGSWETGSRSFARRASHLADLGYAVFDIEYRLAPPPRHEDATGDVKCAVGWVRENAETYGVNPDRIALMGDSAGGHLALLSAYTTGDPDFRPSCGVPDGGVDAVVALYPPTEMATLCESNRPAWYPKFGCGSIYRFMGGTPEELPERYEKVSPVSHVDAEVPPTFMAHGGRDQIVLVEQSRILERRLEAAGVPHERVEIPYADHIYDLSWGGWANQITNKKMELFLDGHFPGDDAPISRPG